MTARMTTGLGLAGLVGLGAGLLLWRFGFFMAPFAWTGEPARLAGALGLEAGMTVADVGAGSGDLAVAMARIVGGDGVVFATELTATGRATIARLASSAGAGNVRAVAAERDATGLADESCDALYLRTVFHHVEDPSGFAAELVRTVRPGGRIAIIDFAPGTLWFHGGSHGVAADTVRAAFAAAGWRARQQIDDWGGGMFLLVFESAAAPVAGPDHERRLSPQRQ